MPQLVVLTRSDGPYYATIRDALQTANGLRNYFRFVPEGASWLPKETGRAAHLADKKFRGEIRQRENRVPSIVVTSIPLYGGNFN